MKKKILLLMPIIFLLSHAVYSETTVHPVEYVDLNRYQGTWYEVASYPQIYQRNCVHSQANYALDSEGQVIVTNSCYNKQLNGRLKQVQGTARVVDQESNAKLKVKFSGTLWSIFIPEGDYWIIELDPNYQWAVVGEPKKKALWILSRVPYMSQSLYNQITEKIRTNHGYDTSKLRVGLAPAITTHHTQHNTKN